METIILTDLKIGESAAVSILTCKGSIKQRLIDLGFTEGSCVKCVGKSPLGSPRAYEIKNAVIAIRNSDAAKIEILP